jgi:hypothetical protein
MKLNPKNPSLFGVLLAVCIVGGIWYFQPQAPLRVTTDQPAAKIGAEPPRALPPSDPQAQPVVPMPVEAPSLSTSGTAAPDLQPMLALLKQGKVVDAVEYYLKAHQSVSGAARAILSTKLAKILTEAGGAVAADFIRKLPDTVKQQQTAVTTAAELVKKDPKEAVVFAESLAGLDAARSAFESAGKTWADRDRSAAIEWINSLDEILYQQAATRGIASAWMQKDLDGMLNWAKDIPDEFVRNDVYAKTSKMLALTDPPAAVDLAMQIPEGMSRNQALTYGMTQWLHKNSQEAAEWATSGAPASAREPSQVALGVAWINKDPQAAAGWISGLSEPVRSQIKSQSTNRDVLPGK